MKRAVIYASLSALVGLSACGGGGGNSGSGTGALAPTAIIDKYLGAWAGCFTDSTITSHKETITLTKTGDTSANFTFTESSHAALACAGSAIATDTGSGSVVLNGSTKTIGADTVDKGTLTQAGQPAQLQVFLVKGTPPTLATGQTALQGGAVDAEGYPNTLGPNALTKQ